MPIQHPLFLHQKNMKLITEQIEEVKFLTEDKDGKKNHYIQGVFLQGEIKNRNGRVYPMTFLKEKLVDIPQKTFLRIVL